MADWKNDKDLGSWPFVPQKNKWAYLNNPKWTDPAEAFIIGGVHDYNGRESEEPQIWTPTENVKGSRNGEVTHHQCGHWHKKGPTTAPFAGFTYEDWHSCPEFILPSPTTPDQVWFITTLDKEPIDYFRIIEYVGVHYYWEEIYNFEVLNVESWEHWDEPDGSVYRRGNITAVALLRTDDAIGGGSRFLEVFVYNLNTLINHTILTRNIATYGSFLSSNMDSKFCVIDELGNIHIILKMWKAGIYSIRDFVSSDNGATFNYYTVVTPVLGTYGSLRDANIFSTNTIYCWNDWYLYQSVNHGVNWARVDIFQDSFSDMLFMNDTFFGVRTNALAPYADVIIQRSTTGMFASWATVLTIPGEWTRLMAINCLYDGTYYYIVANFRNSPEPTLDDGYTYVYRSANGVNWNLVATIVDEANVAVPHRFIGWIALLFPCQIVRSNNTLFYMFYYGEMSAPAHGGPNVYLMTVWKSEDDGVTWEVIYTPFYDVTRPGSVPPSGPWS